MKSFNKTPDEQVALLVSLLENSTDLIIQLDCEGAIRFINRVALGLRNEDVVGTSWLSFISPDQQEMMKEHFQKTLTTGANSECEVFRKGDDGNYFWYLIRFFPLKKGSEIDGAVLVSRDITEQKQMQNRLELQQSQVVNFFKQAPALICMLSGKDFTYRMVNQEYERMLGNRDVIGKPLREVFPFFDEEIFTALNWVYETNQSFLGKDVLVNTNWKGGDQAEQRYFTFLFKPVTNSAGSVESIWVLAIDVTESKRMESTLQLNDRLVSLGTLAAGIGHEINNPLAYSILNLDIIQCELLEILGPHDLEKTNLLNQKIDIVHQGLQRVAGIVKGLKIFSHSADAAEMTEIELHECIDCALEIGANIIKHRSRIEKDYQSPVFIMGNATKMVQVFLNLLVNAAHAMEDCNFSRNIISIRTRSNENGVEVIFNDTGKGISPENLKKIFDPFFTTKEVGMGSGLGLPICHGIITAMGGTISFESIVGVGTKVNLTFPLITSYRSN